MLMPPKISGMYLFFTACDCRKATPKKIQHERNDDEFGLYIIHCFHGTSFLTVLFLKVFFLYYDGIMIYDWIRFSYCKPKIPPVFQMGFSSGVLFFDF